MDVCELIFSLCSWSEYRSLYLTDTRFRGLVQRAIRRHIASFLNPFLKKELHCAFWSLMEATGSCLIGGFVRCVMFGYDSRYHLAAPTQLDIVIPKSYDIPLQSVLWDRFWISNGYENSFSSSGHGSYKGSVDRIIKYHLPVSLIRQLLLYVLPLINTLIAYTIHYMLAPE